MASQNPKEWIRIGSYSGVTGDLARIRSIYPRMADRAEEFYSLFSSVKPRNVIPETTLIYSLLWALISADVMAKSFAAYGRSGPMHGMDVGGGYGFLACQLAMPGHTVVNSELRDWRIHAIQPWAVASCGVQDKVSGRVEAMEDMEGDDSSLDFICFMGSLLCCKRDCLPKVLCKAMRMLAPGGILIVRENLLGGGRTGSACRFSGEELQRYLQQYAGSPRYFDDFGIEYPPEAVGRPPLVSLFAAVQKHG
jgi:SAM-dependent methyltransferase